MTRRWLQFRLRSLLILTAVVAVVVPPIAHRIILRRAEKLKNDRKYAALVNLFGKDLGTFNQPKPVAEHKDIFEFASTPKDVPSHRFKFDRRLQGIEPQSVKLYRVELTTRRNEEFDVDVSTWLEFIANDELILVAEFRHNSPAF